MGKFAAAGLGKQTAEGKIAPAGANRELWNCKQQLARSCLYRPGDLPKHMQGCAYAQELGTLLAGLSRDLST